MQESKGRASERAGNTKNKRHRRGNYVCESMKEKGGAGGTA